MTPASSELRSFVKRLHPVWRLVVIDPEQLDSEESWESPDMVPEVCNSLLTASALVLLAYYEHVTRRLKRGPRSAYLDQQLDSLLSKTIEPLRMTGAQALTTIEWALECDAIPMLHRESLQARHMMFLNVIARERYDQHHRDYNRFVAETLRAPVTDLVRQILRAISFMETVRPEITGSAYARYEGGKGKQREELRFPLGPFFASPHHGEILPFWRFDPREQKYIYQSLWSGQEYRRSRPARAETSKGQQMVTALLSSSFRPLAELARVASWHLKNHGPSLRNVLTGDHGRSAKTTLSAEEFLKDPLMSTWRLITEFGPIGLLERDDALADTVFRQVHNADDDLAIREIEMKAGSNTDVFRRLLALETARHLGLEVHALDDIGQIDRLKETIGSDQHQLDLTDDEDLDNFARDRGVFWAATVENELRFLIVFYASLQFRFDGAASRMGRDDIHEVFNDSNSGIHGLWNRFRKHVLDERGVGDALRELTGRSSPVDGLDDVVSLKEIVDKIAEPRNRIVHDTKAAEREEIRTYLAAVSSFLDRLRGTPVRPVYPYLLTFKTAVYTSGGLTTLQYSSHLSGGGQGEVVVYTSRHIDLARTYYCLPRIGQSELAIGDKRRDRRSVLVDPLLIDADAIARLIQQSREVHS